MADCVEALKLSEFNEMVSSADTSSLLRAEVTVTFTKVAETEGDLEALAGRLDGEAATFLVSVEVAVASGAGDAAMLLSAVLELVLVSDLDLVLETE